MRKAAKIDSSFVLQMAKVLGGMMGTLGFTTGYGRTIPAVRKQSRIKSVSATRVASAPQKVQGD